FDVALGVWFGQPASLCIFSETCGSALALEHNGDVYSCDHFVEPDYHLGNLQDTNILALVSGEKQIQFGRDKRDTLPQYCRDCAVRFICNGGCPKNRIMETPKGEPGLNHLCEGYKAFFKHIDQPMKKMVQLLNNRRPPAEIMNY
ncbi:MAG: SPASM domain-containing protein, partial [Chloroflexota bacterium]